MACSGPLEVLVERAAPADVPKKQETSPSDPRRELVQRVASSAAFQKSKRLRDFLLFVCERALREPESPIREHEIGAAVFGRPADFDPSEDTLVRVQASQLRKRLQKYFSSEGAGESIIIEIPKGTYTPVFRDRTFLAGKPQGEERHAAESRRLAILFAGLALLFVASSAWLWIENRELRRRTSMGLEPRPAVDRLWRQMFGNGRHTYVILADGMVTMFQDLVHVQLSASQYQRQQFRLLAEAKLHDPLSLDFARRIMNRPFTSIADANLARRIGLLNAAHGMPTDVILAREAGPQHLKSQNAVLSGPRRANPWVELFEDRLNFRSGFDEEKRSSWLENRAPQPGESPRYVVEWDRVGYCRVAYLPNLDGTGSVLIISGTDMSSSDAGSSFVTSERWIGRLRSLLGLSGREPMPHFEVLLRTQLVLGAAANFELIAHRVPKP